MVFKKGNVPWDKGIKRKCPWMKRRKGKTYEELYGEDASKKFKMKISKFQRGRSKPESQKIKLSKYRKGKSYETLYGADKSKKVKMKISKNHRDISLDKNPNWKGGITLLNQAIRTSFEYKQWIKNILERDNFICLGCGKNGGNLEAHHKKAFAKILKENNIKNFEEALNCKILWNIQNGMTLCPKCHAQIDKFRRLKNYVEVKNGK